jgi:hypothetical protein
MGLGRNLALPVAPKAFGGAVSLPVISGSPFPSVPSALSVASQSVMAAPAGS